MPQVWLSRNELAEFLECSPEVAENTAFLNNWPTLKHVDDRTRYQLPPVAALRWIVSQAKLQPDRPYKAVLFDRARAEVESLKRQLADAQAEVARLTGALATASSPDLLISSLQDIAGMMRREAPQRPTGQDRSAA